MQSILYQYNGRAQNYWWVLKDIVLRPVFKHLKFLGFQKASQESEMKMLFQNCILNNSVFIAHSKYFTLIKDINQNDFAKRLENCFPV